MKKKLYCVIAIELILMLVFAGRLTGEANTVKGSHTTEKNIEIKKVALTFDDGPDPVYTPMLLDGLSKRNVKATFFVLGKQAELYPKIVKRMYDEGHLIGNHTYHHVQLTTLSDAQIEEELKSTNEIIHQITGEYPNVFRPPFGSIRDGTEEKIDMLKILWDIDPCDWCCPDEQTVVKRVLHKIEDNSMILMHDASKSSVDAALEVVDVLQEQGYTFVTADEIVYE